MGNFVNAILQLENMPELEDFEAKLLITLLSKNTPINEKQAILKEMGLSVSMGANCTECSQWRTFNIIGFEGSSRPGESQQYALIGVCTKCTAGKIFVWQGYSADIQRFYKLLKLKWKKVNR